MFKSKIKWAALGVLVLSFLSLLVHLFLANSTTDLGYYSAVASFNEDINIGVGGTQVMLAKLLLLLYVFLTFNTQKRHACLYTYMYTQIIWYISYPNWYSLLYLKSCGERWSLWSPCSHMQNLEADILVIFVVYNFVIIISCVNKIIRNLQRLKLDLYHKILSSCLINRKWQRILTTRLLSI